MGKVAFKDVCDSQFLPENRLRKLNNRLFHILLQADSMAKPIESGIELEGEAAIRFIKRMLQEQTHPNPRRVRIIREALADAANFRVKY